MVVVLLRRAELGQGVGADVVVGHDQAVGRDERPRAAVVEPDRRGPQMLGPAGRRLEAVPRLELGQRQVVEHPHALVAVGHRDGGQEREPHGEQEHTLRQREPHLRNLLRTISGRPPSCPASVCRARPDHQDSRWSHRPPGAEKLILEQPGFEGLLCAEAQKYGGILMAGNTHGCVLDQPARRSRSPDATAYIASIYFKQATALLRQGAYRRGGDLPA